MIASDDTAGGAVSSFSNISGIGATDLWIQTLEKMVTVFFRSLTKGIHSRVMVLPSLEGKRTIGAISEKSASPYLQFKKGSW